MIQIWKEDGASVGCKIGGIKQRGDGRARARSRCVIEEVAGQRVKNGTHSLLFGILGISHALLTREKKSY
jgi:hypothetical protein